MTHEKPYTNKWVDRIVIMVITAIISIGGTHIFDGVKLGEAVAVLRRDVDEIRKEQLLNTAYRTHMQDYEKQAEIDRVSILDGQRKMELQLEEHHRILNTKLIRIEEKVDLHIMGGSLPKVVPNK